jgi:hypothetical protein
MGIFRPNTWRPFRFKNEDESLDKWCIAYIRDDSFFYVIQASGGFLLSETNLDQWGEEIPIGNTKAIGDKTE